MTALLRVPAEPPIDELPALLQKDSGLPATGFVDEATARALQDKLDAVGQQESMQTAALQTALKVAGFWDGPIDGHWSDARTKALVDLQNKLGVEPTGRVDAATIAAFEQAIAAPPTTVTSEATSTETAIETATETTVASAIATATVTETATKTATESKTATASLATLTPTEPDTTTG